MALIVQKFGGTAVAGAERIRSVARRVAARRAAGDEVVVVVSAMGSETDELLDLAGRVAAGPQGRELDVLVTAGERKSTALVALALQGEGWPARSFTGAAAGIRTDESHAQARIVGVQAGDVWASLRRGEVPVVAGAQGLSLGGDETFLGRGGSDTTAVALAHELGADACQLYTDVDGVYTADPRLVPGAQRIKRVSWEAMLEMCASGCPKPDSRAVEVAQDHGVTIEVRSAFGEAEGSTIGPAPGSAAASRAGSAAGSTVGRGEEATQERWLVSAVSQDVSEAMVTVSRLPADAGTVTNLFHALAAHDVDVDMIVKNSALDDGLVSVSFTTPKATLDAAVKLCEGVTADLPAARVGVRSDIGKVSVLGAGLRGHPGVAARMLRVLADRGADVELIGTSPIRMSCVIDEAEATGAVRALHEAFELGTPVDAGAAGPATGEVPAR
ncbi:MAG: aspartate kinase [Acidimicrobiia bacterium]|nr:aspartate kinase [Acidimicrobiia bacterium]